MQTARTSTPIIPTRIQLIGRDNGAGLSRDMTLLSEALAVCGQAVTRTALPHRGRGAEWLTRLRLAFGTPAFNLNVMLERVRPEFSRAARHTALIPNPEYFRLRDRAALGHVDWVWTKTRHATRLFEALGARVYYIGFSSPDRYLAAVPRRRAFFHGPGRSGNKGTEALLRLWSAHPEWPSLTLVWRRKNIDPASLPANVTLLADYLDDDSYRRLQNEHRFHLCPSRTEGYGHYIAEAMSCGAVVVTLDAEPMHELVTAQRGVLVPAQPAGTQDLATLYDFTDQDMAAAVERCLIMPEAEAEALSQAAMAWHAAEQSLLPQRLCQALKGMQ